MLAIGLDYEILLHGMNSTTSIWHYSMKDVYNQTYLGLEIDKNIGNSNWYLKPSYLKQDSIGKLDQTRAKFDTYQAGIHLGAKWRGFDATVKYAKTGEADIIAPFGDKKVVTQQVMQSSRENERVYSAKLAYRFREETPLHGLSAYINYGLYQFEKNPDSDITETEISMHYQLSGFLKGMAFRVRHSFVDYETGTDIKDTRFYLFYKFII